MTMWIFCTAAVGAEGDRDESQESVAARAEHATPRLKASYRLFSIAGLEASSPIWLQGAQLDIYGVSERWVRFGLELEGGSGTASWQAASASIGYGLFGVTAGIQYPARVTPFLEGRFVAGGLFGELDGTLTVGTTTLMGTSGATWVYGGGLETGVEVYLSGRVYLSGAVGWMHSSWHGVDVPATTANPRGGVAYKDLVGDSFTVKVGLGI